MSCENNRLVAAAPEPSNISESSMDFSLNYTLYPGSFLQAPTARAVDADAINDSVPSGSSLLECPPVLDEPWRNFVYSEPFDSSKRQLSQCSPTVDFNRRGPEKKPRLDGTSFDASETSLFKSNLEGAFPAGLEQKAELLGGISESFDFASTPDPPDDNSNLAHSISLIQETLDQSIAQADDRSCEPISSLPRQETQASDQDSSRLFKSSEDLPSGNVQAQSTPLEVINSNGSAVLSQDAPIAGGSSYDSLPESANSKPVVLKEYRLVLTEQVFEKNGEIIRRQMVQREHALERTVQLSQREYENIMHILQIPSLSFASENFADISASQSTSREPSEITKETEAVSQIVDSTEGTVMTENLFDSDPTLSANELKKKKKNRVSILETLDRNSKGISGDTLKTLKTTDDDVLPKTCVGAIGSEPEFKEPKSEKPREVESETTPEATALPTELSSSLPLASAPESIEPSEPSGSTRLAIGSSCLAQWSDQLYYMATVSKLSRCGRYGVKFADGTQESVKGDLLFLLHRELEIGQPVYVKVRNVFEYAVIKDRTLVSQRQGYIAELHTKRIVRVTKDKIVFTQEMVDGLKQKQAGVHPCQDTLRRGDFAGIVGSIPSTRVRKGRSQGATLDTSSEGTITETTMTATRPSLNTRKNVKTDLSVGASESGCGASGSSLNPPTLVFEGMGFLLTDTERAVKNTKNTSSSSYDSGGSQGDQVEFNKEQLQNLIEENGGVVFKSFTEAECANSLDTGIAERYLLSRSHMKTLKYVLCLAAGIRCLGHQIIFAALREGRMAEPAKYQLPAGISLMQRILIEQPSTHTLIFKDMTIAVVAEKNEFVNTWSQVIIAAGGRIASKLPQRQSPQQKGSTSSNSTDGTIRYMVTTPECPGLTLRSARALRIAPVSSEWVVQSIIHAKVLEPDSHVAFAYDYKKME